MQLLPSVQGRITFEQGTQIAHIVDSTGSAVEVQNLDRVKGADMIGCPHLPMIFMSKHCYLLYGRGQGCLDICCDKLGLINCIASLL